MNIPSFIFFGIIDIKIFHHHHHHILRSSSYIFIMPFTYVGNMGTNSEGAFAVNGFGHLTYTGVDGYVYRGYFMAGKKHGKGVLEYDNGLKVGGFWKHGIMVTGSIKKLQERTVQTESNKSIESLLVILNRINQQEMQLQRASSSGSAKEAKEAKGAHAMKRKGSGDSESEPKRSKCVIDSSDSDSKCGTKLSTIHRGRIHLAHPKEKGVCDQWCRCLKCRPYTCGNCKEAFLSELGLKAHKVLKKECEE